MLIFFRFRPLLSLETPAGRHPLLLPIRRFPMLMPPPNQTNSHPGNLHFVAPSLRGSVAYPAAQPNELPHNAKTYPIITYAANAEQSQPLQPFPLCLFVPFVGRRSRKCITMPPTRSVAPSLPPYNTNFKLGNLGNQGGLCLQPQPAPNELPPWNAAILCQAAPKMQNKPTRPSLPLRLSVPSSLFLP
jgi:hypothetical protein